jgi:hypothetical protein
LRKVAGRQFLGPSIYGVAKMVLNSTDSDCRVDAYVGKWWLQNLEAYALDTGFTSLRCCHLCGSQDPMWLTYMCHLAHFDSDMWFDDPFWSLNFWNICMILNCHCRSGGA